MKIQSRLFSAELSVFFVLSIFDMAFAGQGGDGWGYPGHMMGSGYMGWFMILFWGLLLVTLILLIRWVVKLPQSKESGQGKDPLAILNERLAKGEIEVEEYREKKQLLTGKP